MWYDMSKIFEPFIVGFCCLRCGYTAADLAGVARMRYPSNVNFVMIPCLGRVDPNLILKALSKADGVMLIGCKKDNCHNYDGSLRAEKKVQQLKKDLQTVGVGGDRLEIQLLTGSMADKFVKAVTDFTEKIRNLGPNPMREGV
jgi:coenzyme F420-reducing hydrogenase delta subunit